jgi:RNA polymerase sigma-70 factor (ECF subfamily)
MEPSKKIVCSCNRDRGGNEYADRCRMSRVEDELKGLMIAALGGDERAYREALSRIGRYLRGYYKTRLNLAARSSGDAEDLVQETLMALHVRRHSYDPEQPFTPWLYAIAHYKLVDYFRRTRASAANVSVDDAKEITAHDDRAAIESSLDLDRLLGQLPEKFRTAIRYVKLDGLSVAETASQCGMSESAIKVNVHRGMKALSALVTKGRRS